MRRGEWNHNRNSLQGRCFVLLQRFWASSTMFCFTVLMYSYRWFKDRNSVCKSTKVISVIGMAALEALCPVLQYTNSQGVLRDVSSLLEVCLHNLISDLPYIFNSKTQRIVRHALNLVAGFLWGGGIIDCEVYPFIIMISKTALYGAIAFNSRFSHTCVLRRQIDHHTASVV
jgi:hypothetical protein